MNITIIESQLTAIGCDRIIYEAEGLANLKADQIKPDELVGVIIQPDEVVLEARANSVFVRQSILRVQILKQTDPVSLSEKSHDILVETLERCKQFINALIETGEFKKITSIPARKVMETSYDANMIGWMMMIDMTRLLNDELC